MSANNADQAAAVRGSTKLPYTYSVTGNTRDVGNSPASLPYQNSGLALVGGGPSDFVQLMLDQDDEMFKDMFDPKEFEFHLIDSRKNFKR
ncbi:MAG: hypothetical protein U0905_12215 [Pirellulales bacterium]